MAILLTEKNKIIVQGITGKQGAFHTSLMLEYEDKCCCWGYAWEGW